MTALPPTLDRGTPIDPEEVSRRVLAWKSGLSYRHVTHQYVDTARVIVHPQVYEDAYVREPDLRGWQVSMQPGFPVLTCVGITALSDPALRLDEVRIRHDETLVP